MHSLETDKIKTELSKLRKKYKNKKWKKKVGIRGSKMWLGNNGDDILLTINQSKLICLNKTQELGF